ncbi:MAG: PAS domain S-box protein, partial [Rhodospirillales bacterium]
MGDYKRLALLFMVMIGVAAVVGATAIGVLYEAAVNRERARLVNIVQSQARLLEALLRLESSADRSRTEALDEILEAHRRMREQVIGQTAELLLARREGPLIVFLTPARGGQHPIDTLQFGGPAAEPMSAALSGQSGTMIGRDYAGRRVLAAFEPVQELGLGLVAKIDMAEINGTYLQAGAIAGAASLAAVVAGALLFFRVGEPIVRRLRESEERYRSLVETQPDPICRFLPDTTLTFVNRAYAEFYGRPPEELLGRRWIDFAARGERPRFLDELTTFTSRRPERREESASTAADGTRRWHLCHLRAFFDTAGKVASFQSFATDISDRKLAEQRLSNQLSLLTGITDSAADAIFVSDEEERITFMNLAAERIFGWSRQELLGRKLHDSLHSRHPDGHPYPASECPLGRVYATGETVVGHEDVFFRKGGSPVPVACSNAPMRIDGRIAGAILIAHDISNRKQTEAALRESEARYRAAGEAIRYGVWVCDASGGVTFVSQIFLDLIGKTLDEVQPRGWFDRLPPEDRKPAINAWRACVAAGGDWTWEHHVKGADGVYRTILSLGRPVRDDRNRIVSWVGFNLDISRRKEAEDALRESEGRLRRTVDYAPFPIMVHAEDGEVVHLSQAWLQL